MPKRAGREQFRLVANNEEVYRYFAVEKVATVLARRQLGWLGHLARMDEGRVQRMLMTGRRVTPGTGVRGARGASLLGVSGQRGTYIDLINTHLGGLSRAAKLEYFGEEMAREHNRVALAANKAGWKRFVKSVVV